MTSRLIEIAHGDLQTLAKHLNDNHFLSLEELHMALANVVDKLIAQELTREQENALWLKAGVSRE